MLYALFYAINKQPGRNATQETYKILREKLIVQIEA